MIKIKNRKIQLNKSLEEIEKKQDDYSREYQELKVSKERLEGEHKSVTGKIVEFKKKHKLGEESEKIESEIESIDFQSEKKLEEVQKLRAEQHELIRQKDILGMKISGMDEKLEKISNIRKEHKEKLNELGGKRTNLKNIILKLNNDDKNNFNRTK